MDYGYGNNYNTSYGGQGAADGGGFIEGDQPGSQQGSKTDHGMKTLRPVTIKQIIDGQHMHATDSFKIDGEVAKQVTIVGQIRQVNVQTMKTTYKIDDGTAIIEASFFNKQDDGQDDMDMGESPQQKYEEGQYVRVFGNLKDSYEKRHIWAHMMRPITDMNEVNFHMLEATAVHLYFKHGQPPSAGDVKTGAGGVKDEQDEMVGGRLMPSHLSPKAKVIYKYMRSLPQSNEGLEVDMIASGVGMPVNDVYKTMEELTTTGLTFTTVNEHTWAVLDF